MVSRYIMNKYDCDVILKTYNYLKKQETHDDGEYEETVRSLHLLLKRMMII